MVTVYVYHGGYSGESEDPSWVDVTNAGLVESAKALFPPGRAWPRDADTELHKLAEFLAAEPGTIARRVLDLLDEMDPRTVTETLDEWEAELGLPGSCETPTTLAGRQGAIHAKTLSVGDPTAANYIEIAKALGYQSPELLQLHIAPFKTGSGTMQEALWSELWRYFWEIRGSVWNAELADLLECRLKEIAQIHTLPNVSHWEHVLETPSWIDWAYFDDYTGNWIIVGDSSLCYTSSDDGETWTQRTVSDSDTLRCIVQGNSSGSRVISYGTGTGSQQVKYTDNGGISWSAGTGLIAGFNPRAAARSESLSMIAVVGDNTSGYGSVITSSDGLASFTERLSTGNTKTKLIDVIWDSNRSLFIACGWGGALYTSANGTTWTRRNVGATSHLYGLGADASYVYVTGSRGDIHRSADGIEWTQIAGTAWNLAPQRFNEAAVLYNNVNVSLTKLADGSWRMDGTAADVAHYIDLQPYTWPAYFGGTVCAYGKFKPGSVDFMAIWLYAGSPVDFDAYAYIDLVNGTVGTTGPDEIGITVGALDSDGFREIWISTYTTTGEIIGFGFDPALADNDDTYVSAGSDLYFKDVGISPGTRPPPSFFGEDYGIARSEFSAGCEDHFGHTEGELVRPVVSSGVIVTGGYTLRSELENLIPEAETFGGPKWAPGFTLGYAVIPGQSAPDGSSDAVLFQASEGGSNRYVGAELIDGHSLTAGQPYTLSAWAKFSTWRTYYFEPWSSGPNSYAGFFVDLEAGTILKPFAAGDFDLLRSYIKEGPDGWKRLVTTFIPTVTKTNGEFYLGSVQSDLTTYSGTDQDVYLWKPELVKGLRPSRTPYGIGSGTYIENNVPLFASYDYGETWRPAATPADWVKREIVGPEDEDWTNKTTRNPNTNTVISVGGYYFEPENVYPGKVIRSKGS